MGSITFEHKTLQLQYAAYSTFGGVNHKTRDLCKSYVSEFYVPTKHKFVVTQTWALQF